jgi:group I intron endonuclease
MNQNDIKILPKTSGIYKITSPNGKVYIGESFSLKDRCKYYLNPNRIKKQRGIYNSIMKYGIENHILEIKELCSEEMLLERERFWQEFYDSVENGLNCHYTPTNEKKKHLSLETIQIISEKSIGEFNAFYGKKHTEESLLKISQSSKGENNPNYGGKFHNEEYLKKQSLSNSKKPIIVFDTESNETHLFKNSKEASRFIGCSPSCIRESKKHGYKVKKKYLVKSA